MRERIDAAQRKFDEKFGDMGDEWTELFSYGLAFARGLLDTTDKDTLDSVVVWLERAADSENNY